MSSFFFLIFKGKCFPQQYIYFLTFFPRSNYVAAHHAANLMVPRKTGLIINISSYGGLQYLFNVPYGVGKEAVCF